MSEFSERLRNLRSKQCTQEELADKVGVHFNTVSRWELGKLTPDLAKLRMLATTLNTTVSYLTGETDNPAPAGAAPLVDASSATVNAPIAAGHDHVTAIAVPQTMLDFSNVPQLAIQMKKQGNIAEMKDAIDFLESAISVLKRAVQESVPA